MTILLDTHFVIWIVTTANRLSDFRWLTRYTPWSVSPVSLLELQFLSEAGRLVMDNSAFASAIARDPRFVIDEVPLAGLIQHALPLSWTRDPFDRLLAAHSLARRVPLCTVDRTITAHHAMLPKEISVR